MGFCKLIILYNFAPRIVKKVRYHISRFFVLVIALQVLNMSIDSPTAQMNVVKGQTDNFNYIDTYVEFIVEVVLKYENAIPESNSREHKELQQYKYTEYIIQKMQPSLAFIWVENLVNRPRHTSDRYAYQYIREINPPPPRT